MIYNLKKIAFIISSVGAVTMSSSAFAACKPSHEFTTVTPGTLKVVTMVIPPFSIPKDGGLVGVDGDIISKIAAKECLKLSVSVVDPKAVAQYVLMGRADVGVGNWFRTAAREQVMGMSNPVYVDSLAISSKEGTTKLSDLVTQKKIVGTVKGYNWVSDLQQVFGDQLKLYPNPVALVQDLESGRIDAGLDSYSVGIYIQQQGNLKGYKIEHAEIDKRVIASMEPAQIAFLLSKKNTQLKDMLNANLADLHKSGEIGKTLQAYGMSSNDANVGEPRLIQ